MDNSNTQPGRGSECHNIPEHTDCHLKPIACFVREKHAIPFFYQNYQSEHS